MLPRRSRLRLLGRLIAAALASVLPWWVIVLIEPRPSWTFIGIAEAILGMRDFTLDLAARALWVNGAILGSELCAAGLLAYFISEGRIGMGWRWGAAIGIGSIALTLVEPLFWTVVPRLEGRTSYYPQGMPMVYFLRNLMLAFHITAMAFLPQAGGVLGAAAVRRRRALAPR